MNKFSIIITTLTIIITASLGLIIKFQGSSAIINKVSESPGLSAISEKVVSGTTNADGPDGGVASFEEMVKIANIADKAVVRKADDEVFSETDSYEKIGLLKTGRAVNPTESRDRIAQVIAAIAFAILTISSLFNLMKFRRLP